MTLLELSLALLALLITPGPTNAVLALAGAQDGLRAGPRLVPVVLLCYLSVVAPLVVWGGAMMAPRPLLRPIVTALAALWVAWLAFGLWRRAPATGGAAAARVGPVQVAVTTLLNPKSLIFGLVLIPAAATAGRGLLIFAALVPLVSAAWAALGAGAMVRLGPWLNKGSALWLGALAVLLAAKAVAG